jgi:hypothetical protein
VNRRGFLTRLGLAIPVAVAAGPSDLLKQEPEEPFSTLGVPQCRECGNIQSSQWEGQGKDRFLVMIEGHPEGHCSRARFNGQTRRLP